MKHPSWQELARALAASVECVAGYEPVTVSSINGRVTSEVVCALRALPAHTHAVMDGYALGSSPPGQYTIINTSPDGLSLGEAQVISAGGTVPHGTVVVVLADHAHVEGDTLSAPHSPRKNNIRRAGEEADVGDVIIAADIRLDARHAALARAAGVDTVMVRKRPRVALVGINSGMANLPHLTMIAALLNGPSLALTEAGSVQCTMLPDLLQRLAPKHDLIIVVAESLGGEHGLMSSAITEVGGVAGVYRAALKPAKPIITGKIGHATLIGLAGTAYATTIAAHLFVRPVLLKLLGRPGDTNSEPAFSDFVRTREMGRAEALPVLVQRRQEKKQLTLAGRFGQLRALASMDGFAIVEAEQGDIKLGTALSYVPLLMPLV